MLILTLSKINPYPFLTLVERDALVREMRALPTLPPSTGSSCCARTRPAGPLVRGAQVTVARPDAKAIHFALDRAFRAVAAPEKHRP